MSDLVRLIFKPCIVRREDMINIVNIVLYVICILWIAAGTFLIIYTEQTRKVLKKIFPVEYVKVYSVLPFIFGIFLVVGAFYHGNLFWLTLVLGLLCIIKGIYLFFGPLFHVKKLCEWWFSKAHDRTVRMFGLIIFTIGIAVLSYL